MTGLWTVWKNEERDDGADNRYEPFDDEDPVSIRLRPALEEVDIPSPTFKTSNTVHLLQSKGKQTREGTGQ